LEALDLAAVAHDRLDNAFRGLGVVAQELGRADLFAQREPHRIGSRLARARPGGARLLALALHGGVEAFELDADAARALRMLGEVERKAVGVVERERDLAGKIVAARERAARLVENREPALERLAEAALLEFERLRNQRLGAVELRIGLAHLARQRRHELPQQRLFGA